MVFLEIIDFQILVSSRQVLPLVSSCNEKYIRESSQMAGLLYEEGLNQQFLCNLPTVFSIFQNAYSQRRLDSINFTSSSVDASATFKALAATMMEASLYDMQQHDCVLLIQTLLNLRTNMLLFYLSRFQH
jgi:hypothetical protein